MLKRKEIAQFCQHGALLTALLLGALSPAQATEVLTPAPLAEQSELRDKLQNFTLRASDLALAAIGMLGIRYQMGGSTPEGGLDCSGLVRYVFKQAWGAELPRTSEEISRIGKQIAPKDLQPGDLVFYNTVRRGFSHVGIYLGDSNFIHAPARGGEVRIESMNVGYWRQRFNGARRMTEPTTQE